MQNNTFVNNVAGGSSIADGSTTMDVWGNPTIQYNNFVNPANTYEMANGNSTQVVNAEDNWWGTTDSDAILARLYDAHFNTNFASIDYSNWLGAWEADAPPAP